MVQLSLVHEFQRQQQIKAELTAKEGKKNEALKVSCSQDPNTNQWFVYCVNRSDAEQQFTLTLPFTPKSIRQVNLMSDSLQANESQRKEFEVADVAQQTAVSVPGISTSVLYISK